nr:unnamed protein product [Digitaria exilis]
MNAAGVVSCRGIYLLDASQLPPGQVALARSQPGRSSGLTCFSAPPEAPATEEGRGYLDRGRGRGDAGCR